MTITPPTTAAQAEAAIASVLRTVLSNPMAERLAGTCAVKLALDILLDDASLARRTTEAVASVLADLDHGEQLLVSDVTMALQRAGADVHAAVTARAAELLAVRHAEAGVR